jgi:hypothetical protein
MHKLNSLRDPMQSLKPSTAFLLLPIVLAAPRPFQIALQLLLSSPPDAQPAERLSGKLALHCKIVGTQGLSANAMKDSLCDKALVRKRVGD